MDCFLLFRRRIFGATVAIATVCFQPLGGSQTVPEALQRATSLLESPFGQQIFDANPMPLAIASTGPGAWLFGTESGAHTIDTFGRTGPALRLGIPTPTTCMWANGGDASLVGACQSSIPREGQDTLYEIHAVRCDASSCSSRRLLQGTNSAVRPLDVSRSQWNQEVVAVLLPRERNGRDEDAVGVFLDGAQVFEAPFAEPTGVLGRAVGGGRAGAQVTLVTPNTPVVAARRGSLTHVVSPYGVTAPFQSAYDWDLVADGYNGAHLVYYDPEVRSLSAARYDPGRPTHLVADVLDSAESGFEQHVERVGDRIVITYYFYRNAFYKGLRRIELDPSGAPLGPPVDLFHDEGVNLGWGVVGVGTGGAESLLCYGVGASATFSLAAGDAARVPIGYCSAIRSIQTIQTRPTDYPNYRNFFFLAGLGTWYRPWYFLTLQPDPVEDLGNVGEPFDLTYRAGAALQNEAVLEGRIGRVRLGLSYAQSIADEIESELLSDLPPLIARQFRGVFSIEDLIGHHDLQFQFRASRLALEVRDQNEPNNPSTNLLIESDVNEYWLTAVNIYRMSYGLRYQSFGTQVPIYTYIAQQRGDEFRYVPGASGPATVRMHDVTAVFGYSLLDYAVKYETRISRFYADAVLGAGVAIAEFLDDDERFDLGEGQVNTPVTFAAFGEAELGYLWYRRFATAAQLGLYLKGGLRVSGQWRGSSGRPDPRERKGDDNDDQLQVHRTFSLIDYRFGPFIQLGTVF